MQAFISKYALAVHIAFLAASPLFLFIWVGEAEMASVLLWLSFIGAAWYFLEPSRRGGEMLHDARRRVVLSLCKDPLFWVFAVLAALTSIRFFNDGVAMTYDASTGKWSVTGAFVSFLPSCVTGKGRLEFALVVALATVVETCRHALGKAARTCFLFSLSLFAGIAAIIGAFACYFGWGTALLHSECQLATSSYAGTAFGICMLAGTAALAGVFEKGWNGMLIFYSFSIGACATGLYFFAPSYVVLLYLAGFLVMFVASVIYAGVVCDRTVAFKTVAAVIMGTLVPAICCMWLAPKSVESARLAPFANDTFTLFSQNYWKTRELCCAVASKVWNSSPWLGSGLGSFGLDMNFNAAPGDWTVLPAAQSAAVNGWWHLLAERGLVGAISYALVAVLLLSSFVVRAIKCDFGKSFIPAAALSAVTALCLAAQTFFDISLYRADVLLAALSAFSLGASSFVVVPQERAALAKTSDSKKENG